MSSTTTITLKMRGTDKSLSTAYAQEGVRSSVYFNKGMFTGEPPAEITITVPAGSFTLPGDTITTEEQRLKAIADAEKATERATKALAAAAKAQERLDRLAPRLVAKPEDTVAPAAAPEVAAVAEVAQDKKRRAS